ncbi:phosphatidate cytidylyltransferase [Persephonella sp. KM09-Lau-8]|uniref:phosphatidate cytidylyltransferase n=1 Tax=Persephonella sp. KM09-Lau-8 TaxID=1158345 RepID=UPI000495EF31|nr:phosphatidate cytidylyltransferase [Persephonella sp. KM09-Lau-8]
MGDLTVRTISGIVLAAIAIAAVLYLPVWAFKIAISVIALIGTWEVFHLLSKKYSELNPVEAAVVGFLSSITLLFVSVYLSLFIIFLYGFYVANKVYKLETLGASITGLIYAVFFISSIAMLHQENRYLIFVLFATVWAGDTMAYFVGKAIGKHKLAPRLSPKKTWEGAIGSFIGSVVAGGLVAYFFGLIGFIIPVVLAAIFMQIGDLFESFIKRQVGEKDSSHLIPGHGGILDRIDALIFASVIFVSYIEIVRNI